MLSPLTRAVGPFMDNEVSPILVHSMEKNDEVPTPPLKMTQTVKSGANENLTFKMGNKDLIQVGATHPLKSDSTVLAFDQNRKSYVTAKLSGEKPEDSPRESREDFSGQFPQRPGEKMMVIFE